MPSVYVVDLNHRLSPPISAVVTLASSQARRLGFKLYLVGGVVRDLLLGRPSSDIDLTVDGDAPVLAKSMAKKTGVRLTIYGQFGTARLEYPGFVLHLATARKEIYTHPGALPTVQWTGIDEDLFRRDFTINAMALSLNFDSYGVLIDPYGGKDDLNAGIIRVLHSKSFMDDATRIWRAIRYEQRLGFRIERNTLHQLRCNLGMLDTISADRIRHELERTLEENMPEKVLRRAWQLGILQKLHPSLRADRWLCSKYRLARNTATPDLLQTFYISLLAYRLSPQQCDEFIGRLKLPSKTARTVRDIVFLHQLSGDLAKPGLRPSRIYELLNTRDTTAISIATIAATSPLERRRLRLYLDRLRHTRISLTGRDLQSLGVPPGPKLGTMLRKLLTARLDGKLKSRRDEEGYVRHHLATTASR